LLSHINVVYDSIFCCFMFVKCVFTNWYYNKSILLYNTTGTENMLRSVSYDSTNKYKVIHIKNVAKQVYNNSVRLCSDTLLSLQAVPGEDEYCWMAVLT